MIVAALFVAGVGCGGSGGGDGPTATIARPKSTTTTAAMTAEARVEAAYLRSWKVYAKAMRTLDASGLDTAFAKDALTLRQQEVARLSERHLVARMQVEHQIVRVNVEGEKATLLDNYVNHSVVIDPKTGDPAEPDPNSASSRTYTLERIDGTWFVTFVFDNSLPSASQP